MLHSLLLLMIPAQLGVVVPEDSVAKLRGRARSAEATFERLARNLAPFSAGGWDGRNCDEIVGRFCLRYDSTSTVPESTEVGRVVDARRDAVEAIRRYFSVAPGDLRAAGPLVRLLVHDDRAREAVSAARTFAALSPDSTWANLLLALAFHAAKDDVEAERHFVLALRRMDVAQQRAWADPRWLLDQAERSTLRRLAPEARADYERKFWLASDPFWLTQPNESWIEHMARYAESRLLEDVPLVGGMIRWGEDLDELTVRYGTPTARSRLRGDFGRDDSMVEYFDTASRNYAPDRMLSSGFPELPEPGTKPILYSARARSGYAMRISDRVLDLPHQLSRFLDGRDIVWRVDAALAAPEDSLPTSTLATGFFVYDSAFTRRVERVESRRWEDDSIRFTLMTRSAPGPVVYSVEAVDTAAGFAARARYASHALVPGDGPILSDLLICAPFPAGDLPERRDDVRLNARGSLIFAAGDTLGVYAEVYRLGGKSARVEIGIEPANAPGAVTRLGRWLGRSLGLIGPPTDPRVAWRAEGLDGVPSVVVNLPLDPEKRGRFVLVLTLTDLTNGRTAESRRVLLVR